MDKENIIFPLDFLELDDEPEDFNIKDYLFEPNPNNIKDISDYDTESDWIPRIDRFGDYIGDGILEPRRKIVKAVFHGFYEDLNKNSEFQLLKDSQLTFVSSSPAITFKEISDPVHIMCYNEDVLYYNEDFRLHESDCWGKTNFPSVSYNPHEKFLLHTFELIRLLHPSYKLAEFIKLLSIFSISKLGINGENYFSYSTAIVHFALERDMGFLNEKINLHEYPIYLAVSKSEIIDKSREVNGLFQSEEFRSLISFRKAIFENVKDSDNLTTYELASQLDKELGSRILSIYQDYLESINNSILKQFISIEMIIRLYRVFPDRIPLLFHEIISETTVVKVSELLLEDLRSIFLMGTAYLYKNFQWGWSLVFNIIASCHFLNGDYLECIQLCSKSNVFIQSKRDFFQILFTYCEVLRELRLFDYIMKILEQTEIMIFERIKDRTSDTQLEFIEYYLLMQFVFPIKLLANRNIEDELNLVLRNLVDSYKLKANTQKIGDHIDDLGHELFEHYVHSLRFDDVTILLKSFPIDLLYIFYQLELNQELPDLDNLVKISLLHLSLSEELHVYSYSYPITYNYTQERVVHFINLFVFYYITGQIEEIQNLKIKFKEETKNKIEFIEFKEILESISSEKKLDSFILNSNVLTPFIDRSLIYYLRIKELISIYLQNHDKLNFINKLTELIEIAKGLGSFRPYFEGLKLLYGMILSESGYTLIKNKIHDELKDYVLRYGLEWFEIPKEPLSDEELRKYSSKQKISIFLSPIRL